MSDPRFTFLSSVAAGQDAVLRDRVTGTTIRIVVGTQANGSFAGQVLIYQLATLTSRLFDRVMLTGDDAIACHPAMTLLSGPFLPALRSLLPTIRPLVESQAVSQEITIVVGDQDVKGSLFLGSTGWRAIISTSEPQAVMDTSNPLGALAAGTLGASEIFKQAFTGQLKGAVNSAGYSLSLLTYKPQNDGEPALPDQIDFDATLYGCGSIGCGFLTGLLLAPQLHGNLTTVDNGRFDTKNPYKYSLLNWSAATQAPYKAVWAQQKIQAYANTRIKARAYVGTAEAHVASLPSDYRIPLALSAVDTFEARFEIQDTLPCNILNAGIDGTLAMVSVHGFGNGPCLACLGMERELESWNAKAMSEGTGLRPERVYDLIRQNEAMSAEDIASIKTAGKVSSDRLADIDSFIGQPLLSFWNRIAYSEAIVSVQGAPPAKVTTAFVSAFAGVLLLAELVKYAVPGLEEFQVNNSYQQDLLGVPAEGTFRFERDSKGWCLCHSSYRLSLYKEKYGVIAL